jgi:predicted unusual protein kinase regulating ubiquinone biosynthesis (AarF/ABC1/UbiB family)
MDPSRKSPHYAAEGGLPSGEETLPAVRPSPLGRPSGGVRFRLRTSGIEAAARLALVLIAVALSQILGSLADWLRGDRSRHSDRRLQRSSQRLARTLGSLKGAFAKAGQFASLRHDLLPAAASAPLAALQDHVPPLAYREIRSAVERELGAPLERLFASFEPAPLGAASVAQVHRARLLDGTQVAVKVQYPWIEAALAADLVVIRALLALATWITGRRGLDRRRLLAEFAEGLGEELDFEREARVAREIAANLAGDAQIVVPRILESHSSRRVLTMTFHEAVGIGDRAALDRLGIQPRAVLEILARAYAKQVFVDGLFHADPHPGNLFALADGEPGAAPRVLFVDFGLSKRLPTELRRQMRQGIFSLLQRDLEGFVERMDQMGMIAPGAREGVRRAVGSMFERIAEQAGAGSALPAAGDQILGLKSQAKTLLQETPGIQLPNDLLLYAKTLSYLFALGQQLDPEVDLLRLSLPYLMRFLAEKD